MSGNQSIIDRSMQSRMQRCEVSRRVIQVEERYSDTDLAALWGCTPRYVRNLRVAGELGQVWELAGRPCVGARGVLAYESRHRIEVARA